MPTKLKFAAHTPTPTGNQGVCSFDKNRIAYLVGFWILVVTVCDPSATHAFPSTRHDFMEVDQHHFPTCNESPVQQESKQTSPDPPQEGSADPQLPWERDRENKIPRLTKLNEREILADVSEEDILGTKDLLALNQVNQRLFARLLFRIPQFGIENLIRLASENAGILLNELPGNSGFHRLKVFKVEGRARHWERRKLTEEVGELFDLSIYYKIKVESADQQNVIVYCNEIPKAWKENQELNEFVSFEGLYLNYTKSSELEDILNFVADRVRWIPKSRSELVTRQGPSLLGSAGFDLGLLDFLPARNRKQLDDKDTETFFQFLAAVKVVANSRNAPDWKKEVPRFDLIKTLRSPEKYHGDLSLIPVEIRNITRVGVDKAYIRERIGIREYYQLDGFVKFDSTITYKDQDGKPGAVFKDKYPVTICVNQLPPTWKAGSGQHYSASFPAFFFRLWAYPSGYQSKFSDEALQQSPVLFALDPVQFEQRVESVNWTAIGLCSVLGIGLLVIWTNYYVARAKRDRTAAQFSLPGKFNEQSFPEIPDRPSEDQPVPGMPVIKETTDP